MVENHQKVSSELIKLKIKDIQEQIRVLAGSRGKVQLAGLGFAEIEDALELQKFRLQILNWCLENPSEIEYKLEEALPKIHYECLMRGSPCQKCIYPFVTYSLLRLAKGEKPI